MNDYKRILIYYFSGTGNSKNVARWLQEFAEFQKIECKSFNIAQVDRKNIEAPDEGALVVFVSPVHGFNYPPVMLNFIRRFPKGKNKVALMNTRAGMLIGKWITPGLSGVTFYLSAGILKLKGYKIMAMFPVDLPSNWILLHPGLNKPTVQYLHDKNKERVAAFANKVFAGGANFKGLAEIGQDMLIAPVSFLYYFIGRFILAKTLVASSGCTHCNVCIKTCPVKAIKEVDGRPYWTFNCESCMRCVGNCPEKAIEAAHGFIIGMLILFNTTILYLFYHYFSVYFFEISNKLMQFFIEAFLLIIFLAISYRLVHFLMRYKFFERLVVYSSLTKYRFWGRRYKALNV